MKQSFRIACFFILALLISGQLQAQVNTNLLINWDGSEPVTTGWTVNYVSGNEPGFGQITDFNGETYDGFAGTWASCPTTQVQNSKSQVIDLVAAGLDVAFLDASPDIAVSESFRTYWGGNFGNYLCARFTESLDLYYLKVELRDASNNTIATINWGTKTSPLTAPYEGVTHSHTFSGYGPGVRYIYFEDGGQDVGYWDGFYGTFMENASVKVLDPDTDGDGVTDSYDNCVNNANSDQADGDCDGVGDVCDVCNGGDDTIDNDGDGNPDCHVYPGYENLESGWTCSPNGNNEKVKICHDGVQICVAESAVAAHLEHGDYLGNCDEASCVENRSIETSKSATALYPNPAQNEAWIDLSGTTGATCTIRLMDMNGVVVRQIALENSVSGFQRLDLDGVATGMYFVQVVQNDRTIQTLKLLVQKH